MRSLVAYLDSPWRAAAAVFSAAVLATLLFSAILPDRLRIESSDYLSFYEPVARNLLDGRGLTSREGDPAVYYPPGYPLLLAGIFGLAELVGLPEDVVFSAFTLLTMGATAVFVFLIARSLFGPRLSLIASLVWCSYPFVLWLTQQHGKEVPYIALLYASFLLYWYAFLGRLPALGAFFFSGVLAGLAMLVVPMAIGVGVVLAAMVFLFGRDRGHRRWLAAGMIVLGNVLPIIPWEIWAYSNFGRLVPLSSNGIRSAVNGYTWAVRPKKDWRRPMALPEDVEGLMHDVYDRELAGELETLGGLGRALSDQLRTRPLALAKLLAIKTVRSWYGTASQKLEGTILALQIPFIGLTLWGAWAAWRHGGAERRLAISLGILVLYFWSLDVLLALSLVRYMVPVIGLSFVIIPAAFLGAPSRR